MDVAYDGTGLSLISLANTAEPLYGEPERQPALHGQTVRSGNRVGRAGFDQILLRGDTDFSQTR